MLLLHSTLKLRHFPSTEKGLPVRRCEVAQADFGHLALPTAGMSMAMAPATSGAGRKLLGSL